MERLEKVEFKDKIVIDNLIQERDKEKFITGKDVNELKHKLNNTIDRSNNHNLMLESLQDTIANVLNLNMFEDQYPSKTEISFVSGYLLSKIDMLDTYVSGNFKTELKKFKDNVSKTLDDFSLRLSNATAENTQVNSLVAEIPNSFSKFDSRINLLYRSIDEINANVSNVENNIKSINDKNVSQDSDISKKYNEFKSLKTIVQNNTNRIVELEKENDKSSNNLINQLFIDNTNILYYIDQCQEKLYLQDMRLDFLERLARGMSVAKKWEDWHRLFSLLNLIKLKISRLSLDRHTQLKDTIFSEEEKKTFKYLLSEIELKIKNFSDEEIEEVDIEKDEIYAIINKIDELENINPGSFEFYPNYPEINE